MTTVFSVGMKIGGRRESVTVEAEDALVAALKVKLDQPSATINYVRKRNSRGDRRHPHQEVKPGGHGI
jgi:hypothetical protein